MGYSITALGILSFPAGAVLLFMRNRSKGQMVGKNGRAKGTVIGPVWFMLMVFGIFLMALSQLFPF